MGREHRGFTGVERRRKKVNMRAGEKKRCQDFVSYLGLQGDAVSAGRENRG